MTGSEHEVVSHEEWVQARKAFLAREKEFTRQREALAAQRRNLPWEAVTREYVFEGPAGKISLPDLFDGCGQRLFGGTAPLRVAAWCQVRQAARRSAWPTTNV